MKPSVLLITLSATLLLAACDQGPDKPPMPHTDKAKPESRLFQDQRNALDKAKAVGPEMEEQAQRQRDAAEQQEK